MNFHFTIIVCVYNCEDDDLIQTLSSCITQKDIVFEILIADDCSERDYEKVVNKLMKRENFTNYKYLRNCKNLGTVKNILGASKIARGQYIKTIGAGDILYNVFVLKKIFDYMNSYNYKVCFGLAKAYKIKNDDFYVSRFKTPYLNNCYKNEYIKKIQNNLIICEDQISGAVLFFEKNILCKYLEIIEDKVIYVEDFIPRLMVLDNVKIGFLNENVIYYQYGTGISTKSNKKNNQRMQKDQNNFDLLIANYKDSILIKKYLYNVNLRNSSKLTKFLKKTINNPSYFLFTLKSFFFKKTNFLIWKKSKI